MDCERYQNEIEDFLYGELTERRAAEMRAHLADCLACAGARDRIERENELFAQFYQQTEVEPAGEMWEAIRSRIQTEPQPAKAERGGSGIGLGWFWKPAVLRQFAFAALLVVLSVGATIFFLKRNESGEARLVLGPNAVSSPSPLASPERLPIKEVASVNPTAAPSPPAISPRAAAAVQKTVPAQRSAPAQDESVLIRHQLARAEREYKSAIGLLDRAIARRRDHMDTELIKQYESSLALIDDSIAQSRQALRQRPGDLTAGQFLLAAYAKKVELMQDIAMR